MTREKAQSKKKMKKVTFTSFLQSLYLTSFSFFSNDLLSYASSCAFGFLYSFIPIITLAAVVVLRIANISPDTVINLIQSSGIFTDTVDFTKIVMSITSIKRISNFEIITGIAILIMARRFFVTTISGINCIFKNQVIQKPLITQTLIIAGEAILIILISVVVTLAIAFRTVQQLPNFENLTVKFPGILNDVNDLIVSTVPYLFIFTVVTITYQFCSRCRPKFAYSAICALGCTLFIMGTQKLLRVFLNMNRYNIVYGVLSNLIVLLLEVWFFFIFFLFFAQQLFVIHYFDTLIIGELYLLPPRDSDKLGDGIKRILFINPSYLTRQYKGTNVVHFERGQQIYTEGDEGTDVLYILKGTVEVYRQNNVNYIESGAFFGEQSCMLNEVRIDSAKAVTEVDILKISSETFFDVLDKNINVSRKALSRISKYFSRFYGLSNDNSL